MKKKQILTIALLTIWGLIFFLLEEGEKTKQGIWYEISYLFDEAINQDYQKRIKEHNHYYSYSITENWPEKEIRITSEKGMRILTNVDSIRSLSVEKKIRLITESTLFELEPVNPDTLNAILQRILTEHKLPVYTGICCNLQIGDTLKTIYSGTDSLFFAVARPLKQYKTGIFNETVVIPYAQIPFPTIVKQAGSRFIVLVIAGFVLLASFIFYWYLIRKKRKLEMQLTAETVVVNFTQIEVRNQQEMPVLDKNKGLLTYKGKQIYLSPGLTQLMDLFLDAPDHFLPKKQIAEKCWVGLDDCSNRLTQSISRLRSVLAAFPEIEIESVFGAGYRLIIHDTPDSDKN